MRWQGILDAIFPYIEPLEASQQALEAQRLLDDVAAINAASWSPHEERALDEAQRVAGAEMERVRTAEGKATTYLAVLAALVPIIITLQAANWEKKTGPAPDAIRLFVLAVATVYIAAAGYHAFKTLQVAGFQRVGESEVAAAWRTPRPLPKLIRGTLLASRRSRKAVNAKVTRIRVTHEHLLRAFGTFVLLLLLDPLFYVLGFRNVAHEPPLARVVAVQQSPRTAVPVHTCMSAPAEPMQEIVAKPHTGKEIATISDRAGQSGCLTKTDTSVKGAVTSTSEVAPTPAAIQTGVGR